MKNEEKLKKIGKNYGRDNLSINDLKKSIEVCLESQDFEKKTCSFRKQVMLDLFNLNSSVGSIDPSDRRIISSIIIKTLKNENEEMKKERGKQCDRDLTREAERAGFEKYEELDKHLTLH
jgi:hypothetical protein